MVFEGGNSLLFLVPKPGFNAIKLSWGRSAKISFLHFGRAKIQFLHSGLTVSMLNLMALKPGLGTRKNFSYAFLLTDPFLKKSGISFIRVSR